MSAPTAAALLKIVAGRRGHFRLESGHHAALWFDLDARTQLDGGTAAVSGLSVDSRCARLWRLGRG